MIGISSRSYEHVILKKSQKVIVWFVKYEIMVCPIFK